MTTTQLPLAERSLSAPSERAIISSPRWLRVSYDGWSFSRSTFTALFSDICSRIFSSSTEIDGGWRRRSAMRSRDSSMGVYLIVELWRSLTTRNLAKDVIYVLRFWRYGSNSLLSSSNGEREEHYRDSSAKKKKNCRHLLMFLEFLSCVKQKIW